MICGPFGSSITKEEYCDVGIPLLRIGNITKAGTIDERNLVFLSDKKANTLKSTQVEPFDLVISQRGTLGIPAVVPSSYKVWNISANLIAIRKIKKLLPAYIQLYLSCKLGAKQLERNQSGQVQGKLTTEDIASILIPNVGVQQKLVEKMQAARESRKQKLAQADELLAGMDEFLFKQLGFTAPIKDRRFVFGVPISGVTSERIDPHFYHPYFVKLLKMIRKVYHKRLGEFVELSHKQWNPPKANEEIFDYIEISGVNRNTGEIYPTEVQTIEAPSRARMIVRTGDIIISLTRPHHGSIGIIDDNMDRYIASTGFAIIHKIKDTSVNPIYLWTILRSQICLQQMLQRSSGGNYPAITEDQLLRISIPIPPTNIQDEIVREHIRRSKDARRLREEAEKDWQRAKADFEAQLFGEGTDL